MFKNFIKYIIEPYIGPNCDIEIDKKAVKQPQIKLNKALIAL